MRKKNFVMKKNYYLKEKYEYIKRIYWMVYEYSVNFLLRLNKINKFY